MKIKNFILTFFLSNVLTITGFAQISPGDLSKGHANLVGANNCTKCHTTGSKISSEKCLDCHKEIKASIISKKGFHATAEVGTKQCITCHVEHKGRDFQIAKINKKTFDHSKMGFELKGVHAKKDCNACHKAQFISDPNYKARIFTFRGLKPNCLNCHSDFHQGRLSSNCLNCHNFDTYKNPKVVGFDHNKTNFPLKGKHTSVDCIVCHKTEIVNGKPAQRFTDLQFKTCTSCHKDVHESKFGNDCQKCHTEESFHNIKNISTFNHDLTKFALLGRHKFVNCKSCHKTEHFTDPIRHDKCSNCHTDYHKGDFAKKGVPTPDCKECHTNDGFKSTTFTISRHNLTAFQLEGAHLATSCIVCHKKQNGLWSFSKMGTKCVDCHKSIHQGIMSEKFLANDNCTKCHNTKSWKSVEFDHELTGFKLEGVHATKSCGDCHFKKNTSGERIQKFQSLTKECSECHKDNHVGQFAENGKTECLKCHSFENWKDLKFAHNTTRFKLEGAHQNVECNKCHKQTTDEKGTYIKFKFKSIECTVCHS